MQPVFAKGSVHARRSAEFSLDNHVTIHDGTPTLTKDALLDNEAVNRFLWNSGKSDLGDYRIEGPVLTSKDMERLEPLTQFNVVVVPWSKDGHLCKTCRHLYRKMGGGASAAIEFVIGGDEAEGLSAHVHRAGETSSVGPLEIGPDGELQMKAFLIGPTQQETTEKLSTMCLRKFEFTDKRFIEFKDETHARIAALKKQGRYPETDFSTVPSDDNNVQWMAQYIYSEFQNHDLVTEYLKQQAQRSDHTLALIIPATIELTEIVDADGNCRKIQILKRCPTLNVIASLTGFILADVDANPHMYDVMSLERLLEELRQSEADLELTCQPSSECSANANRSFEEALEKVRATITTLQSEDYKVELLEALRMLNKVYTEREKSFGREIVGALNGSIDHHLSNREPRALASIKPISEVLAAIENNETVAAPTGYVMTQEIESIYARHRKISPPRFMARVATGSECRTETVDKILMKLRAVKEDIITKELLDEILRGCPLHAGPGTAAVKLYIQGVSDDMDPSRPPLPLQDVKNSCSP